MRSQDARRAGITNPYDCTPQATLSQAFATWSDYGLYTPPVRFRFTPIGPTARYQIDDVYVDPWARG